MTSQPKKPEKEYDEFRKFTGDTLIIATHNENKLSELKLHFMAYSIDLKSADEVNIPEPEETEDSYKGNAILKAVAAARSSGEVCLADDSGFGVEVLDWAPGIYSARFATKEDGTRDFSYGIKKLRKKMGESPRSFKAKFFCAIAVAWPDGHYEVVQGEIEGDVVWPPRGGNGFGYDPIFQPEGENKTFGEMDPAMKNDMSHRTRAIEKILKSCFR